jgi:hypothetical protein
VSATINMIGGVAKSSKSYASGLRAYGAFCVLIGRRCHFPTDEETALRFHFVFRNADTYDQYIKHLKFAHVLLRIGTEWYTKPVIKLTKGIVKTHVLPPPRPSLLAVDVKKIIDTARMKGMFEFATICTVARLFMLRVPSEGLPLQVNGLHSSIEFGEESVTITLNSRKNSRRPSVLTRQCVCKNSGKTLCAVCAVRRWCPPGSPQGRIFSMTPQKFLTTLKSIAVLCGITNASRMGSHAFRRGMAQDIIKAGGNLATLMRAGQWSSGAYKVYLQNQALDEDAIASLIINHSDDES